MNVFEPSWTKTWADLGASDQPDLYNALIDAYDEPQRHYHTQQHLAECLEHFNQARHMAERPGEVEIALWFHDAIYDVRGKSNERQSADWALRALRLSNVSEDAQRRVERLIMATKHDATPTLHDEKLLVDIDLAILGASPERFAEYDRQVRAEYRWVPDFVYNMKRKDVLRSFLARPYLYSTSHYRERYEVQARANLATIA